MLARVVFDKRVAKKDFVVWALPACQSYGFLSVRCEPCRGSLSKVPLDSAGCLPTAASLAAGEAVGEKGEEGDNALLRCVLVVCIMRRSVLARCCLTLMMALQMVTMPLTMAMKHEVMAETRELNWIPLAR